MRNAYNTGQTTTIQVNNTNIDTNIKSTKTNIVLTTETEDTYINLNGVYIADNGKINAKNDLIVPKDLTVSNSIYLPPVSSNPSNESFKLYTDTNQDLIWNSKNVLIEDDDVTVNNISITGTMTIGNPNTGDFFEYTWPSDNGFHSYVLATDGQGALYWTDVGTSGTHLSNLGDTNIDDVAVYDMIRIENVGGILKWVNTKNIDGCAIGSTSASTGAFTTVTTTSTITSTGTITSLANISSVNVIASGDISIGDDLTVTGDAIIESNLTVSGDTIINGSLTASEFGDIDNGISNITTGGLLLIDVDGTGINEAGSITFGNGSDAAIYFNGTNLEIDAPTGAGIELSVNGTTEATMNASAFNLATGNEYQINGTSVLSASTLGSGITSSSLTTVGTISTGVWNGTAITVPYGGTGTTSLTSNAILTGNGTSAIQAEGNLLFDGSTLTVTGDVSISGSIKDSNNNEVITITATTSAVNEFTIANNSTGNNPTISATGGDTDIGINFQVKGTGTYNFLSTATTATKLVFYEDTDNGSNTITLKAPDAITANITLTLPDGDGNANQVLKTDGNGVLSWVDQSGGGTTINNNTDNYIITGTGTASTLNGEANLTFDGSTLALTGSQTISSTLNVTGVTTLGNNLDIFEATNDASPTISLGGASTEAIVIQSVYDTGAQTLDKVTFTTKASSVTADKGSMEFYVDEALIYTVDDGAINLANGKTYEINGTSVLSSSTLGSGVTSSSLTTVGALNSGSITSGFGAIDNGISNITTGGLLLIDVDGTGINTAGSITFGTGSDAAIYFNGTNLEIDAPTGAGIELSVNGTTEATMNASAFNLATGNEYQINGTSVLSASTLGSGVTSSSLTTVGTIATGVWNGTAIGVAYGGTGATSLASNAILTGNGTSAIQAEGNLLFDGSDLTLYETVNDGNPSISIGGVATEAIVIQSVYDTGAQTLDKVTFTTKASSATADKGLMEFYVDEALIYTVDDGAINLASGKTYEINGTSVLSSSTLGSGVTSSSLTTVGTITTGVWNGTAIGTTYGGTGQDFSSSTGIIKVSSGTFSVASNINLTSEVTGTLPVANGGTGATTLTSNGILTGNGTSAIQSESNLTFDGSILAVTANMIIDGDRTITPGDGSVIHMDSSTITDGNTSSSGTASLFASVVLEGPTLAATNASVTTTDAATVYINGAPSAGTNQTITNSYGLMVNGDTKITGSLTITGTTSIENLSIVESQDPTIKLASGVTGTPNNDIGFVGERGDENNIGFIWDESADEFACVLISDDAQLDLTGSSQNITFTDYADLHTGNLTIEDNIITIADTTWTLKDNSSSAMNIGSTGLTNLININTTNNSETVTINGKFVAAGGQYLKRYNVNSSSYTIVKTDDIIGVTYTSTGTVTLTLPSASATGTGKIFYIKDEGGNALANNITINADGSDVIDGEASKIIQANYTNITIYSNGANAWYLL